MTLSRGGMGPRFVLGLMMVGSFGLISIFSPRALGVFPDSIDPAPLHRIESNCFSSDFSEITCKATPAKEYFYQNTETLQNRLLHIGARVYTQTFLWYIPPPGGDHFIRNIHNELKNFAQNQRLNDCQKVALTACAINQLIEYDDGLNDPNNFWERLQIGLMAPEKFYLDPEAKGICTEYCLLFAHVGRKLGLRIQELANGLHCFNKVQINKKWSYVEPQEGGRRNPYYLSLKEFYLLDIN